METVLLNNKGVAALQADSPTGGQEKFIEALAISPFESALHNNLGVSFDSLKEIDKAMQSYSSAEKAAPSSEMKFISRFNLAQAFAKKGKIPEALNWYQKALEEQPTSVEVKTNIELLNSQQKSGGGGGQQQKNDEKSQGKPDDEGKDKKKDQQNYQGNQKYKPRPFQGELGEAQVKKILGELKQQEQRIRADYNRKDAKESPRDKDW